LLILIVQLSGFDRDLRIVMWISLAAAFGTCALVLFLRGARIPKVAAVATILSTVLGGGLLQFWYTNQYLPTTIRPALSVTASVEKVGHLQNSGPDKNVLALSVKILTKNISTTRVLMLGGIVQVRGVKQPPNPDGAAIDDFAKALVDAGRVEERAEPAEPASRFTKEAKWDYLYVSPWYRERNVWLDPGHEGTGQVVVYVPERKYDVVRVQADVWFARADRLQMGELVSSSERSNHEGLENIWILRETSLLNRITRRQRYLHEEWWGGKSPVRIYVNGTRGSSSGPDPYSARMDKVYGISGSHSGTAFLSLWEKPETQAGP
jgi:hypothetical protein